MAVDIIIIDIAAFVAMDPRRRMRTKTRCTHTNQIVAAAAAVPFHGEQRSDPQRLINEKERRRKRTRLVKGRRGRD